MKMRGALALLAVALCATLAPSPAEAKFQEIMKLDCAGVYHFLPQTPFGFAIDLRPFKAALDAFHDRISARVKERCPGVSESEIKRRFVPSVDMLLNLLSGEDRNTTTDCPGLFADDILQLGSYVNLVSGDKKRCDNGGYSQTMLFPDMKPTIPVSCMEDFANGLGCKMQAKFHQQFGGMQAQVAIDNCPDTNGKVTPFPYFSLTCAGESCANFAKPCGSNSDCGSTLYCANFLDLNFNGGLGMTEADKVAAIHDAVANVLRDGGVWGDPLTANDVYRLIIQPLRAYWGSSEFYSGSVVGSSATTAYKFCLPQDQANPAETFFDLVTRVTPTCAPTPAPTPYPTSSPITASGRLLDVVDSVADVLEADAKSVSDNALEELSGLFHTAASHARRLSTYQNWCWRNSFNFSELFQSNDGKLLDCSGTSETLFALGCEGYANQDCPKEERAVVGDSNHPAYQCHVASSGLCNLNWVGNGYCDEDCDRPECLNDGGDCGGPATKIDVAHADLGNFYSSCRAQTWQNNSCPEPEDSACTYAISDTENGWYRLNCTSYGEGYLREFSKGCCVCKGLAGGIWVPDTFDTPRNFEYKVQKGIITCNNVHTWDGTLYDSSNVFSLSRKLGSLQFPSDTFDPVRLETQMIALDCDGYFQFGFMTPFLRGNARQPLLMAQQLEKVMISIAKERQNPAYPLVGSDNLFTKLGEKVFGIWSPLQIMWQLSQAHVDAAEWDAGYNYYLANNFYATKINRAKDSTTWVVDFPSSCTVNSFVSTGKCLLKYTSPIFPKIGYDLRLYAAVAKCPNTHVPEFMLSARGAMVNKFPFMNPCSNVEGASNTCGAGYECIDTFGYANKTGFLNEGKRFVDIEYDFFTYFLHGIAGRTPNWSSHKAPSNSWVTDDIQTLMSAMFGEALDALGGNPFISPPAVKHGSAPFCFPDTDPFFRSLFVNGTVYDWATASQGVDFVTSTSAVIPGFGNGTAIATYNVNGLQATSEVPNGIGTTGIWPTASPTKKPTTAGTVDSGASTLKAHLSVAFTAIAMLFALMMA